MRVATSGAGELDVPTMKKYIQYCKAKCAPRLSEEAGDVLASSYVKIRDEVRKRVMEVSQVWLSACSNSRVIERVNTIFHFFRAANRKAPSQLPFDSWRH